ncbi:hypothetical protein DL98DRAFT_465808 [Cadophora sp. DSE1049]|nr:hypothetical protein DL98DRAFT_465808 [Cadophora sp. DSE1049]
MNLFFFKNDVQNLIPQSPMTKLWLIMALMAVSSTTQGKLHSFNTSVPACAMQCIAEPSSISSNTAANDVCTNQVLFDHLERCVRAQCTIRESLTTRNMTEAICHQPLRDRSKLVSTAGLVGIALSLLAVVLRILARAIGGQFGMDDWTMIVAMGFVIPISAMAVVLADRGMGKDIWSIPFDDITYILHIYYFDECLYFLSLAMIRVSILCFYLRIFPQRLFRRIVYAIMAANIIYGTTFVLLSVFQCIPVHAAWTRWDGTVEARCINVNAIGWASAGINIGFDITILILPLPELASLAMSWQRKIRVLFVFGLGSFVVIVGVLRLRSLVKFANTHNVTWDYVPVGLWSKIEVHVSVICACLPAMPSLFRRRSPATAIEKGPAGTSGPSVRPIRPPRDYESDELPLVRLASVHRGSY